MNSLASCQKIPAFLRVKSVYLRVLLVAEPNKDFLKPNRWKLNKKAKSLIVFAIITILLVSIFAFFPRQSTSVIVPQSTDAPTASPSLAPQVTNQTERPNVLAGIGQFLSDWSGNVAQAISPPQPPGVIESAQTINSSVWKRVAGNAWAYFQPGVGVDANTALPYAVGTDCPDFTDWDLGVYIQAVIDAQKIGLTDTNGTWGSYARLDKVLTFLENRELNTTTGYPFWFYNSITGKEYATQPSIDLVDTGRLFVALSNAKAYNSSWTQRIDDLVYNRFDNRTDYSALVPNIKSEIFSWTGTYAYYVASGFASFWPNDLADAPSAILNNMLSAGNVTTFGVSLPNAPISCDPLVCSVFELNNNDTRLLGLARQVYLAHEACYNSTGAFVAFSEGSSVSNGFIYEWVVAPNGGTWNITDCNQTYININPIIFNKVAFSFLALYNTTFARSMLIYLEQNTPSPANGYCDGAVCNMDSNSKNYVGIVGSNSNGLILEAALYAIRNNP
jgi:hypothetical protein